MEASPPKPPPPPSADLSRFKIYPPLPTLWCPRDVPADAFPNLDATPESLKKIYDDALSVPTDGLAVPTASVTPSGARAPALALGGAPFIFGFAFRTGRRLFGGTVPPLAFLSTCLLLAPTAAIASSLRFRDELFPHVANGAARALLSLASGVAASALWVFVIAGGAAVAEQLRFSREVLRRMMDIGVSHVETGRMYLTSEAFIRECASGYRREEVVIQTKVRPYADGEGFAETAGKCMDNLGVGYLDLLAVHGVNRPEHVPAALACVERARELRKEGKVRALGFSFHCRNAHALSLIESGVFDFVNMHFNFFGSYTNVDNSKVVEAAAARGMGVLCISPFDKSGHIFAPSKTMMDLCAPLHPMELNLLFQLTYPGVTASSVGPSELSHLDTHVNVIKLLPVAGELLPPIVHRIRQFAKERLGDRFATEWASDVAEIAQGDNFPGERPMNVSLLTMCSALLKVFDHDKFGRAMSANLSWPGDWCAGTDAGSLWGNEEQRKNLEIALRDAKQKDKIIDMLSSFNADFGIAAGGPSSDGIWKGAAKKVMGALMAYVMLFMRVSCALYGFRQTSEMGEMPKTAN